jgi:hypothetical protein
MQKLELFDETFDPDRTESYELSIQVSLNGFSFCLKGLSRNYFVGLVTCPFELSIISNDDWSPQVDFILKSYNWISKPFKRVTLAFESKSFSIVPADLFVSERAHEILSISQKINDLDEIRFNECSRGLVNVFSIPTSLCTSWLKIHHNTKIVGFSAPSLEYHLLSLNGSNEPNISISFANKFAIIIVSNNNKILHCSSIELHNAEDTVYHTINICKQFNINPNDSFVKLLGHFEQKEILDSLLERYFKNVAIAATNAQSHFSYLITKYKGRFSNLFNQSLCE